MSIERIRKRDGRLEAFDAGKIARAIQGSMRELGREEPARADALAQRVVALLAAGSVRTPSVEHVQDLVERVLVEEKDPDLAKAYILHRFRHAAMRDAKSAIGVHDDLKLSLNAIRVLEKRYLRKNENGQIAETPAEMFRRVADAVAAADGPREGKESARRSADRFYARMSSLEFLPNSPTLMNAGTALGQLSACFVLPVEDSMDGIFSALRDMAFIHQSGGGTGFSFSRLRPSGDTVRSTGGVASGPISFIEVFDKATDVIKQGGRRRGANMAILRIDHADAIPFILCKTRPGFLQNFNISVAVTDEFMEAVRVGGEHAFLNPRSGEVVERRPARDVFEIICTAAWQCGDPGLVFMDEINRANPLIDVARIEATNPCVTGDTWVQTVQGARQVRDLIGTPFTALVNGRPFASGRKGFFHTGRKAVVRLRTVEGYALRATPDHLVGVVTRKTRDTIKSAWRPVGELRAGDEVLINSHDSLAWGGRFRREQGYLLGLLVGDGTLKREKAVLSVWDAAGPGAQGVMDEALRCARALPHRSDFRGWTRMKGRAENRLALSSLRDLAFECGMSVRAKGITPAMEQGSSEFYAGFLRGLFDADGSVQSGQVKGVSVRLAQSDLPLLEAVQRMLLRLHIASTLYSDRRKAGKKSLPDGKGGSKDYPIKAQHELAISGKNLLAFHHAVGFANSDKSAKLARLIAGYNRSLNCERFAIRVLSVTPDGVADVYDAQVPGENAFDANGFVVHNCGEQPLLPFESCNLGSLNLTKFIAGGRFDTARLGEAVDDAVHFLDNVIDVNRYPIPEITAATLASRKIGLGVMGFSDALYRMNIAYDSEQALKVGEELMAFIAQRGREMSAKLAARRGPFPLYERSRWKALGIGPLRNATVTTVAPTGTIGLIAGVSSGIEPVFALRYWRTMAEGATLFETHAEFQRRAEALGVDVEALFAGCARDGSIRACAELPEELRRVFAVARDIGLEWHVKMQAAFQRHSDNGVSKTINLPRTATVEDVRRAYLLAWELHCKGITVYREGSKDSEVLRAGAPVSHPAQPPRLNGDSCDPGDSGECRRCPG